MTLAKTFCSAPWFQVRIDWDGQYRPCGGINEKLSKFKGRTHYSLKDATVNEWMTSDYLQYVKQNLSCGTQLAECNSCWKKEQNNIVSLRQIANNTVSNNQGDNLENSWVKLFIDRAESYQDHLIISADVKLSNVCNFSCAMCSPNSSSKIYDRWKSDLDNKFVQLETTGQPKYFDEIVLNFHTQKGYKHLQDILDYPIKNLKVLGGEPLLDKELFRVLQQQPLDKKRQITLHLVTNGSQNLVRAVDKLQGYKSINFSVSLEGVGKIQDYIRSGGDWFQIEQNILEAKQHEISVSIHHTLQALSVLDLPDLLSWCRNNQLPIFFGLLENPTYLSVAVLPESIQKIVIDNFSKIEDNIIINLINNANSISGQYQTFLEYIEWYERDFTTKLRDIQPLFYTG